MHRSLRAGTGASDATAATEAGHAAATAALAGLAGEPPALIIVYASIAYDLPALLAAIRDVTGPAPLVGATTAGHFAMGEHQPMGGGVAVLALSAGPYRFGVASASGVAGDPDAAGQRIARASRDAAGPSRYGAVLLLTDWLIGDQQRLIHGIYRVTGPRIPTVGGAAGDSLALGPTLVFHDGAVLQQGAVAVWIASDYPLHVSTRHGWEPIGVPMLVSRATDTAVLEMGGRPAYTAFEETLGRAAIPDDEFYGVAMVHPLAILEPSGSLLVRAVLGRAPEDGLTTIARVPAGSAVHVTAGSPDSLLACVPEIVDDCLEQRPDAGVVLAFSCAARAMVLGDRTPEEPRLLHERAAGVPTFGFYSYGEFARTRSVLGTHTATLTAIAL
jgi:hypothetical protein